MNGLNPAEKISVIPAVYPTVRSLAVEQAYVTREILRLCVETGRHRNA